MHRFVCSAALAAVLCTLAACGGSPGSTAAAGGTSGPTAVSGVATPSSLAVVTAKNAQ